MREQGRAVPYVIPSLWINRQLVPPFLTPADDEQKRIPGASGASSLATLSCHGAPSFLPCWEHGDAGRERRSVRVLCLSGQEAPRNGTAPTCSYKPTFGAFPAPANNREKRQLLTGSQCWWESRRCTNQEGNGCRSGAKGGEEGVKTQRWDAWEHPLLWRNARQQGEGRERVRRGSPASGGHRGGKQEENDPEGAGSLRPRRTGIRRDREQRSSQPGRRWQVTLPTLRPHIFPGMGEARVLGSR